jgi:hypothetical protein
MRALISNLTKKEKAGRHHVIMINWRLNSIKWSKKSVTKVYKNVKISTWGH